MKLIVFGATGSVGTPIIQQALEANIEVTAFCRNVSKLKHLRHPKLHIAIGDVHHLPSIEQALIGHDSVCIALGSGKDRKSVIRSVGTQNIITGMKNTGVERLICVTTLGAGDSRNNLNFFWKRTICKTSFAHAGHFGLLLAITFNMLQNLN